MKRSTALTAIACLAGSLIFNNPAHAAGPNIRAVSDLTAAEGQQVVYTVHLASPTTAAATATLRLNNGTAIAGSDFSTTLEYSDDGTTFKTAAGGAASIRAGVSAFRVRVSLLSDTANEGNETYSLSIIPGANLGNVTGYGAGIITNTAVVTPAPSATVTLCANEGGQCAFSGTRTVRYGTTAKYTTKSLTNGTACSNTVFGDPIYGVAKSCWVENAAATTPTAPSQPPVVNPPATNPPLQTGGIPTIASIAGKQIVGGITVTTDNRVIENLHIVNPTGACIVVAPNVKNVIIRNNEIGPCGATTRTIRNEGVRIEAGASNITIQRNVIHDMSTALMAAGAQHPIVFDRNFVYNIRGPLWQGQMVQFGNVRGGSGQSRITCNIKDGLNVPAPVTGQNFNEDHISMYNTLGTSASQPIEIAYNRIRGNASGAGQSGSGMQLGDSPAGGGGSGSAESGYYYVHDNTIVRTNGVGIGVAGGHDIRIENNRIENRGDTLASMTGWGFAIRKFDTSAQCYNISYKGNRSTARLWAFNHDGSEATTLLNAGGCSLTETGNWFNDRTLTPAIFNEPYAQCN